MDAPASLLEGTSHRSVARLGDAWYVLATSDELGAKPLARMLNGVPLVLFRDARGTVSVLLDRCPHRNVPLSLGRVEAGELACGYHGWRFDGQGRCTRIPSLCTAHPDRPLVASFATREQAGLVWVYATPDVEPTHEPYALAPLGEGYGSVTRIVEANGTLHATLENALDVPHTAFLHRGLFRGAGKTHRIRAVVTRAADRVQTEYVGEPRPEGLVGRLLSPSGGLVTHFDRFILPCIGEVEYRIGEENHIFVSALATPVDDARTKIFAVVRFRTRLPSALVKLVLEPVAMRIFAQDAVMLAHQTEASKRFGGERYMSTELDLMGPQIWRLLRRAELGKTRPGDATPDHDFRREIELEV
ncbi:MAG: aromatic ring-hydroxylating dioxygenase subunit alpha [Deltaproteobacteria bacterium]|nr:aromatic ring-hydroxylating dioxygenase subunit alpha [Deltaproteobacteria bacterium]